MSSVRLPQTHELDVLNRLSTDDGYRARFEADPVSALKEAGVDDATIKQLDPASLQPGTLADKAAITEAHRKLSVESVAKHACMVFPFLRLDYGKKD